MERRANKVVPLGLEHPPKSKRQSIIPGYAVAMDLSRILLKWLNASRMKQERAERIEAES